MKFLLCGLLSLFIIGCSSIPSIDESEFIEQTKVSHNASKVSIQVISIETFEPLNKDSLNFRIKVKFKEWSDYPGIVQEMNLNDNGALVEYFHLKDGEMGINVDIHSARGLSIPYIRQMRLYPAEIEGGDMRGSFCQLPQNRCGSVITKISSKFNADYQKLFKTQGKVIKDDRENSIFWSLFYNNGVLIITMPDKSVVKIGEYIGSIENRK